MIKTDLCVIGAAAGGVAVASAAVRSGARVVLVAADVPARGDGLAALALAAAGRRGLEYEAARAHAVAAGAGEGAAATDALERLGVRVIRDPARFTGPREIVAGGARIRARRFLLATGARAALPPVPGLETVPYLTPETILGLPRAPGHLLVLGAGPDGMEWAQAFRRLGSHVTVLDEGAVLADEEEEAAALVRARLRAEGIAVVERVALERIGGRPGAIELRVAGGTLILGTHLLVATGRRPALEGLGLEAAGVARDPASGALRLNAGLRSTNRRIYALGGAAGQGEREPPAGYHAAIVARQMLFALPARQRPAQVPRVLFTTPEIARLGLTEAEARARHGAALSVIRADLAETDRARAEGEAEGFLKLMVCRGRPVGVTIAGPGAAEMIGLWALMAARGLPLSALAATVLPSPTFGELSKRATGAYFPSKLFDNPMIKRVVGMVQRLLP